MSARLIVLPDDGIAPILAAVRRARKSLDLTIFRLDLTEVTKALEAAVGRSVVVRALIAHTNRGGEERLRRLELQLLNAGVTVSRTADDLLRYHDKAMIVDRRSVHVYGFNFTKDDVGRSRSFGVITSDTRMIAEALKLFEADSTRQTYAPTLDRFVVSPENAREVLSGFIRGAQKQLLIYDPKISDTQMIKLILQRAGGGVDVRVIGKLGKKSEIPCGKLPGMRLHVRAMLRDGTHLFLGSQSLRRLELDSRRELGLIVRDRAIVRRFQATFEADWSTTAVGRAAPRTEQGPAEHPQQVA
jgi:phosphatidylserine/phosphatidylglycerophosphate/cardiolipin synthase-like enzyme